MYLEEMGSGGVQRSFREQGSVVHFWLMLYRSSRRLVRSATTGAASELIAKRKEERDSHPCAHRGFPLKNFPDNLSVESVVVYLSRAWEECGKVEQTLLEPGSNSDHHAIPVPFSFVFIPLPPSLYSSSFTLV